MIRITLRSFLLAVSTLVLIACPAEEADESQEPDGAPAASAVGEWDDGVYFAQGEFSESSGWKDVVVLEVSDGSITSARWDGAHRQNGTPKYERSQMGEYGMAEQTDAIAPWFAQADAAEAWLLENQDITELELDDEGRADAISGASINLAGFASLVEAALASGPTGYGMWEDGSYTAEQDEFGNSGWKDVVSVTVIGGRVVAVEWDSVNQEAQLKSDLSQEGQYGMAENSDAMAPWFEQANAAERWLIEHQDPSALELDDEGRSDAVSGASIHLDGFKQLATRALEGHTR